MAYLMYFYGPMGTIRFELGKNTQPKSLEESVFKGKE